MELLRAHILKVKQSYVFEKNGLSGKQGSPVEPKNDPWIAMIRGYPEMTI